MTSLTAGARVKILSVSSCARGLPQEQQIRLRLIKGEERQILKVDGFGFPWFSFEKGAQTEDFCLLPTEVEVL